MMTSSYSLNKAINFTKGDAMNKNIKIFNIDAKGNKIEPQKIIIKDKVIYGIIKKYIKIWYDFIFKKEHAKKES